MCARSLALVASIGALAPGAALAEEGTTRSDLRRSLREYLFLNARIGLGHRQGLYAEGAAEGPDARSSGRVYVNGALNNLGGFGAYVGLGAVGVLSRDVGADVGDPFADSYDQFDVSRNLRVFNAYAEYRVRDEERDDRFLVRAGRLASFDRDSNLLLCDGLMGRVWLGRNATVEAYGGRRGTLDKGLPDGRQDISVQLCAGARGRARFGRIGLDAGYRFEGAHRPGGGVELFLTDRLTLGLRAEGIISTEGDDKSAVRLRTDGDFVSRSGRTGATWLVEAQLGTDPRPFGRGGLLPRGEDIAAAAQVSIVEAQLDRLFFGTLEPHLRAYASLQHWLTTWLALQGGGHARIYFDQADRESIRPQLIDVWGGPEIASAAGYKLGVEGRYSNEDPGEPGRLFAGVGDGIRTRFALVGWSELPIELNRTMSLAVRPEVEANWTASEGPLASTEGQLGVAAGAVVAWVWAKTLRIAGRYDFETRPEFGSEGLAVVHRTELWLEGTY